MDMGMDVLDEQLQPVPDCEKGEICIYGSGVAMGYWNKSASTDNSFVLRSHGSNTKSAQNHAVIYKTGDFGRRRSDGQIEFLGRIDNQINIRGHRVELVEIEKAMNAHPLIDQAVVVACHNESGEPQVLSYFQAKQRVEISDLMLFLRDLLAPHMLPSRYTQITEFPLTSSGKVDRQALQSPEFTVQAFTNKMREIRRSPDDFQQRIADLWKAVLEVEEVRIDDDFFELGGNSLKAITLILALEKKLGFSLPIAEFHKFSTVENMANDIKTMGSQAKSISRILNDREYKKLLMIILGSKLNQVKPGSLMLKINEDGHLPPLFWCFNSPQKEMSSLARRLPESQPLYGMISSVPLENNEVTLKKVAAHYVEECLQHFPVGPYRLGGNCRGAKVIVEMIRLFEARNIKVEKLCLLEYFHPDLYTFDGDLCLLFGRYSHLRRYELLKFDQEGWEKPFTKQPRAEWLNCAHGVFFDDHNVEGLSENVRQWLYSESEEPRQTKLNRSKAT
jgi:acyl carrier protein